MVPDEAVIETLVRAKTIDAVKEASEKTDRAFKAGALAIGAGIKIETLPGYLPSLRQNTPGELKAILTELVSEDRIKNIAEGSHGAGSTDVGDVQHLLPVLQFQTGGIEGGLHQADFTLVDEDESYILTAKIFALSAYRLLKDGASLAKKVKEEYKPVFANKEEYTAYMDSFDNTYENEEYGRL